MCVMFEFTYYYGNRISTTHIPNPKRRQQQCTGEEEEGTPPYRQWSQIHLECLYIEERKCWAIVNIHIPATTPVTKHIPISPLGKIHTKELLSRRRKKQEKSGGVWYYKFPNDSYLQYIQDFINKITPLAISLVSVHHLHILCLVTYTTDMQNTTPFSRWMASSDVFYAYDQEWTSLLCLNLPSRPSLSSPCVPMCVVCVCVLSASLRRILGSKASKSKQWTDM